MTLSEAIFEMFSKRASSPAQRAVNAGAPDAAENPTEGQKRVGNYQKVHLNLDGFRISIENPKGSYRSGTASDGTKWRNMLACDYGDIRGTESVDGDPVDIYLSDHPEKGAVFVIDQIDPKTKKFDEHKVMYGFDSIEDAKKTYLACYQKGWGGLGWITPVSKAEFRKWIDSSTRKTKPFHEYASVKPIVDTIKVKAAEAAPRDDDADHPVPEEMKKKFPIGKWVSFPHSRMSGKVRKIVGYFYGGTRDNGKDYYCCWLESPDIEEGKRGKVTGLAMYGGYGDHPGSVFNSQKEAQKHLDDEETASGYKAKQEEFAKEQEKTAQAKQDDPMEGVPAGVKLRSFIDAPATRTAIMDNVLEAVKNRFPIEDDDVRLELRDVKYEGPTSYTLEQQKQALLNNRRLGCSIAGTWRLTDKKTGQVLDERRDGIIRVPYYTDRGTIINNGNEYTVISQARLSPGVYVRRKQNGELESQFNVDNGLGFRIGLDKETGALNMSVGQGHVPLYPVLRALGVSGDDIRKSWGDEIAAVNLGRTDPHAIDKVYARLAGRKADMNISPADKAKFITEALSSSGLDPDVVVRTLGLENVNGVTGQVMLRAAQKLLNINRGAEEPDERDNPRFSKFYGVEDMMRERIDKDAGRLTKSILFRAKRDKNLARIGRNALAPYLDTFLSGSGLAMPGEEANPLSILTQQSRITRLGEGGISSPDLVTPEARNVQGDYLGYVDFISGPESFGIGIDVRAALGTMKGSDHRLYNKMVDLHTGKTRYVALDDAASHTVAFPGQDPKSPQLYAMRKGVPTMVPRDEVDYMVPGFGNTVSMGINMTPMPTAVQTNRMFYSSKFWEQYLPQKEGEVPLVDSLMDDGKTTYGEFYGRKVGCLTAPFAGTVVKVNDSEIVVRGKDGQTHTASIVKGLPFNRMTSLTYIPQVKKGDVVDEGSILASSNFTDAKTGAINIGRNLKVAVLPAPEGASSYEDAIVISESAAKKLATSRTYGFEQDTKEGVQVARNKYLAAFPKAYTKEQADTIDDNGVVKVGTILHRDDPMILAIGPKMLSAEDAQLGNLSSVLRNALTDKSQKWEHDWPGEVTDVVAGPHGVKVLVKSEPPVKVGDKLAPEHSLKGVVGGIIPDDKMPRDATTNEPYDMLMNPMGFLSRVAPAQIMLMNLAKVAKKTGKQIRLPQTPPPEGWLEWTEKQMAENGIKPTADVFDPQTGRTIKNVGDGYAYIKAFHHLAEKKYSARGVDGAYTQDEQPAKGGVEGAKRISGFDNLALLSHGATEVIKDSMVTRGQCFDEDTEVLTKDGWKYWREVSPTDELFTKNKDGDGSAFYEKPERLVVNPYNGIMYGYENRHIDWLVTPDHDLWGINCLVSKNKPYRRYRTFKAKDIFGKEGTIDAFGAVYHGSLSSDHILEFVDEKDTRGKGSVKDVRISLFDYCSFMGWWLSEGCASYNGLRGEIRICQDADIHPNEFREIVELGRKIGLGNGVVGKRSNHSGLNGKSRIGAPTSIRWRSKPLALHLMRFGNRAWNKRIPEVIFEAPLDCRLEFLRCYVAGDGCTRSTGHGCDSFNHIIGTSSPMMMHDLQRLAVISGLSAHIGLDKKSGEYNYKHDYYRVVIGNNTKETTIRRKPADQFKGHYKQYYSGYVYCATMSTGLVFVRRNGKCMWSGNCNDEYWRRYRLGLPVEEPGVPFIYKKFINTLKAGGVNVVEKGDVTSIMPQTDADIDELAQGRVLENSQMVDSDFQPVKGGMFDLGKTGGMGGNRWSMIVLPEAVPNPMMEEPVRRVLGLTAKKMEAILSGREELNGKTGGDAIKDALSKVNIDESIERARADIQNRRGSQRDNAIKVLGYLKAAKEMGKKPEDWMITRVPVLPPMFRPVAKMGDVALVPDMNELYKDLIEMKDNYEALAKELPASALTDERLAVYGAVKAAYGLGDPITSEGQAKNLKGAIRQIIGTVPKMGMYQSKVISKTQDNVGRSVTIPDKNLDMDQIGLPEDMAWEIYKPHVERKLIQRGYSPVTAKDMIEEKNATAKHILEDAMSERPVLMDRAPTWHKFNIMAFKPHIVDGRSIHVSPLIDSGFNMDHDGDTVNIHVPASEKAAKQALEKMLPSKNLFSLTDMKSMRYKPEKEQISGLWALTRGRTKKPTRYFNSKAEAIAAYRNGEIGPNDPVEIKEA